MALQGEINDLFDGAVNEICGPATEVKKSESKTDYYNRKLDESTRGPDDRFWREFEQWQDEKHKFEDAMYGCIRHKLPCRSCGTEYEVWVERPEIRKNLVRPDSFLDRPDMEYDPYMYVKEDKFYCIVCRIPFVTRGEIRFVKIQGKGKGRGVKRTSMEYRR
jgi:hypothetical protein